MQIVHPKNELGRLEVLRSLGILGSEQLPEFDALVDAAAAIFDCPIALISLVDETEQWFKAKCGLDVDGTSRDVSFCQYALLSHDLFVIPDAMADDRFRDNPLVTDAPHIRFYAGCPLTIDGKYLLGTLCVIGREPKVPADTELNQLRRLGRVVEGLIKVHRHKKSEQSVRDDLERAHALALRDRALLEQIANVSGVGGWEVDLVSRHLTWTQKTYEIYNVAPDFRPSIETALAFYDPEARPLIAAALEAAGREGADWDLELPFTTAKGEARWVRSVGRPIVENGAIIRLVGALQDVTQRMQADLAIKRSEAVHRITLDSLSEGIVLLARSGRIVSSNPASARLLGDELTGKHISDLNVNFICDSNGISDHRNPLTLAVDWPEDVSDLIVGMSLSGQAGLRWLKVNAVAIENDDEFDLAGVVVSLSDITETKNQADTLQVIFDNFPGGVVHYDENLKLSSANAGFQNLLHYPADLIAPGRHMLEFITYNAERGEYGPGDPVELARARFDKIGVGSPHTYERLAPDGKVLEVRGTPLPGGGILSTFFDVTERKKIERELVEKERLAREASSELKAVLANMRQGVSVFDANGRLTLWNQQYIEIFDKPSGEVELGVSLADLIEAQKARGQFHGDVGQHVAHLMDRLRNGQVVRTMVKHPSGKVISTVHAPLPTGGWIGTHEDVTVREVAAEKIAFAAHHDTLTGLANRTQFNARIDNALRSAAKDAARPVLMLLDLDRFKPVNDTYGHAVGDELLVQVAHRLTECVRSSDLVARLGGDEFAILISDIGAGCGFVAAMADRILERIRAPFALETHTITVGISIGIAPFQSVDSDVSAVIKRADQALYAVKNHGRNGYRFHDEEIEDSTADLSEIRTGHG